MKILEHSLITGMPEKSSSETCSDTKAVSGDLKATATMQSLPVSTVVQNQKNGGTRPYEVDNRCPEKCPKCFHTGAVHREADQYGTYDSCRICGWLDNVGLHPWWTNDEVRNWKPSSPSKMAKTGKQVS